MGAIKDQKAGNFMKHWGAVKKPKKIVKRPAPQSKDERTRPKL